jgi:hypothetical protein
MVVINAANGSSSVTIKLAPWCTYRRTAASSPNVMPGQTGLPTITGRITLNGLTITDGNKPGAGHRSRSAR